MKQGPVPKTSQAHLDAPNWLHARTYQSSGDVEVGQPESHQHKVDPPQQVPAGVPAGSGVEATGEHVSKVFHLLQERKGKETAVSWPCITPSPRHTATYLVLLHVLLEQ